MPKTSGCVRGGKLGAAHSVEVRTGAGRRPRFVQLVAAIKLNHGSQAGVRFNQPVISTEGQLVGRISEVGPKTSWAVLVGDPNCRFSALIKESRNQGGIVAPRQFSSDYRVVELTYLPNDAEVRPGQTVVTSGLGGAFPKEIPVGVVEDSWLSKDGLYIEARVKLNADLNQLEEVRVLTEY